MKYLVTGGAGFIGSNFIHYLFDKHPDSFVVNMDKLNYGEGIETLKGFKKYKKRHKFVKKDICNLNKVIDIINEFGIDTIVHFAASTHVDTSIANVLAEKDRDLNKYKLFKDSIDSGDFVLNNIWGTHILLEAAIKTGVKRFHHISTDEVFGDLPLDIIDKFTEKTPYKPSSPYAASKAASDHLVRAYARTYKLPATISSCSNNYGPYQHIEKLIPKTITNALQDKKIPVYAKGSNIRDWIHVDDHNEAVDLILQKGTIGETYLIGADCEKSNLDVVKTILKILGKPETLIEYVTDRPGHDLRYAIDASKIRKELDWRPEHNFEQGLAETVKWYQENQSWWKK